MKNNIADLPTKALPQNSHHLLVHKFNLVDSSIVGEC